MAWRFPESWTGNAEISKNFEENFENFWLFEEIFYERIQAKDGYANRSYADHDCSNYRIGSVHFNKFGTYAGRFRHGPTGQAPIMNEQQECYMPPGQL